MNEKFTIIEDSSKNNSSKFIFELTETELFTLIGFLEGDTANFEPENYKERNKKTELILKFKATLKHFMREFDNFMFVHKDSLSVIKEPVNAVKEVEEIKDLSHADIPEIVLNLEFIKIEFYLNNKKNKKIIYRSYISEWVIDVEDKETIKDIEISVYNEKFRNKFFYYVPKELFDINKLKVKTIEEFFKLKFRGMYGSKEHK